MNNGIALGTELLKLSISVYMYMVFTVWIHLFLKRYDTSNYIKMYFCLQWKIYIYTC